jgi:prepilin-type N-terminal cleavage/methylation domain-containing protein
MNDRGLSLVEILIATALAGIISAFILMITRSQLIAYEQNDQVVRMQQNERAGVAFVETLLRRACGGIANGRVNVHVPATTAQVSCLTVYDGARWSGGGFANDKPLEKSDAVEIIYGTTPITAVNPATAGVIGSLSPSVEVASKAGFAVGDRVLFSNYNYAVLLQISAMTDGATPPQATLSLATLGSAVLSPDASLTNGGNNVLMKAVVQSIYLEDGSHNPLYRNMLMLDPDGLLSDNHANAQPLVDNIVDFQLALGADDSGNGVIETGEWRGDTAGELPLPVGPWNGASGLQPRWLRASFIYRTANVYAGKSPALAGFEDRTIYPSVAGGAPRYRPVRVTVAPRVWNLAN